MNYAQLAVRVFRSSGTGYGPALACLAEVLGAEGDIASRVGAALRGVIEAPS